MIINHKVVRVFFFIATSLFCIFSSPNSILGDTNLVLHLSFDSDDGANVYDQSGYGNAGTVFGASWTNAGKIGGAYSFSGGSSSGNVMRIPHSAPLVSMEDTREFSIAMWIKPRSIAAEFPELMAKGGNNPSYYYGGYEMFLNSYSDHDIILGSDAGNLVTYQANGSWINNHLDEWIHVAVTVNASNNVSKYYINGVDTGDAQADGPGGVVDFTSANFDMTNDLYIGGPIPGAYPTLCWYDGIMDDVRIYNKALSSNEVFQVYLLGATSSPPVVASTNLLFWNKLGSASELGSSEIGPDGSVVGAISYDAVQFDGGVKNDDINSYVAFSNSFFNGDVGTLEFWFKTDFNVVNGRAVGTDGVQKWWLAQTGKIAGDTGYFVVFFDNSSFNNQLHIEFDGANGGYRMDPNNMSWSSNEVHHLAISFDRNNGVQANKRAVVYLDGVEKVSMTNDWGSYGKGTTDVWVCNTTWGVGSRKISHTYIDNLKFWGYAKTNFSDRFVESQDSLVLHMTFDSNDGTNVVDQSEYGNDGTVLGATWVPTGGINGGGAFRFDGVNDYISIPDSDSIDIQGAELTVSAWICPDKLTGTPYRPIVSKWSDDLFGDKRSWFFTVHGDSVGLVEGVWDMTGNSGASDMRNVLSGYAVQTGDWHHVSVSIKEGNASIYVDGQLDATTAIGSFGSFFNNDRPAYIGAGEIATSVGGMKYYSGIIDEVRVYNNALSSNEIYDVYQLGVTSAPAIPASTNPLVLHMTFDSDDGTNIVDQSEYGNDGTVFGASWTNAGKIGGAYSFSGGSSTGDYIQIPDSVALSSMQDTRELTMALWIKPASIPFQFPDLICKGGNQPPYADGGYEMILNANADHDVYCVFGESTDSTTYQSYGKWINNHLGEWIHVAVTLNSATSDIDFYINGQYTGDEYSWGASLTGIIFNVTNDLYIGRPDPMHHSNRAWFDGLMDDVRIYNKALSSNEVYQVYQIGVTSAPPVVASTNLLLWNKLGSASEVGSSEIGPDGNISGTLSYGAVQHGGGFMNDTTSSLVSFTNTFFNGEIGTLEFWFKTDFNVVNGQAVGTDGQAKWWFGQSGQRNGDTGYLVAFFDTSAFQNRFKVRMFGESSTAQFNTINNISWNAGEIHHFAVAYDQYNKINGNKTIALYLDGVQFASVTNQWGSYGKSSADFEVGNETWAVNNSKLSHTYIDNLKFWGYAKTNFADRFVEGQAATNSPSGVHIDNMAFIAGGSFEMGIYMGEGGHSVTLSDYYMDKKEVTVGDFKAFCSAVGHSMPTAPSWGWTNESLPMVNVTWNEASAYARWLGKRLPTEAEVEYAMRSGYADKVYPWGDTISAANANYNYNVGLPTVAGSYPTNAYGLYDIAGNVWERCSDWYTNILMGPVANPVGPLTGEYKTVRGGSWATSRLRLRCAPRYDIERGARYQDLGFRCAVSTNDVAVFDGDSNTNGIPDWWEMWYFGLDDGGTAAFNASADPDGDGYTISQEYVAGTDPTQSGSALRVMIDQITSPSNGVVLSWPCVTNKHYAVEVSTNLGTGYLPLVTNLTCITPLNVYTDFYSTAGSRFYRVKVE